MKNEKNSTVNITMSSFVLMALMAFPLCMQWDSGFFLFVAKAVAILLFILSLVGLLTICGISVLSDEKLRKSIKDNLEKFDEKRVQKKLRINLLSSLNYVLMYLLGFQVLAFISFGVFLIMFFYNKKVLKIVKELKLEKNN